MNSPLADSYTKRNQQVRVITEHWAAGNAYCVGCSSMQLSGTKPGTPGLDFVCPVCQRTYQLKSHAKSSSKIIGASYAATLRAIKSDTAPHFLLLKYSSSWQVEKLQVLPPYLISPSVVQKRNPLSLNARRAGWTGCVIRLDKIPETFRITLIDHFTPALPESVRNLYSKLQRFHVQKLESRGWLLDVVAVLDQINNQEVTLSELYDFADQLKSLHPNNQNIKAKIRQQLQLLRDCGLIEFLGEGRYLKSY